MIGKFIIIFILLFYNKVSSVSVSNIRSKPVTLSLAPQSLKSKTVRLHLVRHGETVANRNGVLVSINYCAVTL